jgi:hypothetical protein
MIIEICYRNSLSSKTYIRTINRVKARVLENAVGAKVTLLSILDLSCENEVLK